jgi:ABC-type uncharacterized transport system substrate-binding protein
VFNFQYEGEKLKYFTVHNYSPDIILTFPGGVKIYVEIKGYLRYEDQVKMRAVKNANPDLDIRFVFPENGRLGGATKMSVGQWCEKYGFPYTMTGKIPPQWMKQSRQLQSTIMDPSTGQSTSQSQLSLKDVSPVESTSLSKTFTKTRKQKMVDASTVSNV